MKRFSYALAAIQRALRCVGATAVLLLALASSALAAAGDASSALGPAAMPAGYTVQRVGAVRWTYPTAAEDEAKALQRELDAAWHELTELLGVRVAPDLDVRLAVNPEDMQALAPPGRGLPSYATGVAFPQDGLILLSLTAPQSFLRPNMQALLVHELTHVALHRAIGGSSIPRWFSEGVSIHQAGERTIDRIRRLWDGTLRGELLPLARLDSRFSTRHGVVDLAYAQSADVVAFMLRGDGDALRFRALIGELRGGRAFDDAIRAAYGITLAELESAWRARIARNYGRWPSVLLGLSFVWALGAVLLLVGYVRVRRRHNQTLERWAIEEAPLAEPVPTPTAPVAAVGLQSAAAAAPPPPPRGPDDLLDAWQDKQRRDAELPTVVHEGRSYTLH